MGSGPLRNRTFRESYVEFHPQTRCQAAHHRSNSRFVWANWRALAGEENDAHSANRVRQLLAGLQQAPQPSQFRALRLQDNGLHPVILRHEGQDFWSSATPWEKAHRGILANYGPRPVVDEDGTVIGYLIEETDVGVKKFRLLTIDGGLLVIWFDEPGLADSIGNDLLIIVITLGAGLVRGLLKAAVQRVLLAGALKGAGASGSRVIIGAYGQVAREVLERAMTAPGSKVRLVSRLSRAPMAGEPLSVAIGDNAEALANAAGAGRRLFSGDVPRLCWSKWSGRAWSLRRRLLWAVSWGRNCGSRRKQPSLSFPS